MKKKPGLVVAIGLAKPKGSPPPLPGKSAKSSDSAVAAADDDEEGSEQADPDSPDDDADDAGIDQTQIQGEPGTGYEGPEGGPFACHNCNYFDNSSSSCGQETMMKKSQLPRTAGGRPQVDPNGCCEYIDRQQGGAPGGTELKQEQGLKPRQQPLGAPPPYPMAA